MLWPQRAATYSRDPIMVLPPVVKVYAVNQLMTDSLCPSIFEHYISIDSWPFFRLIITASSAVRKPVINVDRVPIYVSVEFCKVDGLSKDSEFATSFLLLIVLIDSFKKNRRKTKSCVSQDMISVNALISLLSFVRSTRSLGVEACDVSLLSFSTRRIFQALESPSPCTTRARFFV